MKFSEIELFRGWKEYSESEEELKGSIALQHSAFVKDNVAVGLSEFSDSYAVAGFVDIMSQNEKIVFEERVPKEYGNFTEAVNKAIKKVTEYR